MNKSLKCKCCGGQANFKGTIDFNRTCHDRIAGRVFPVSDLLLPYYVCANCGFIFTPYMDQWSAAKFKELIYNDEYSKADGALPGYENATRRETISYKNGLRLADMLEGSQGSINILDYGAGGDPGDTGLALLDKGFELYSYEPYLSTSKDLPSGKFDYIYLIEVIEHCHNLDDVLGFISSRMARDGLIHIQTLLHPLPTPDDILNSWYISPRNGHISIFTFEALVLLFRQHGINIVNTAFGVVGFKEKPKFKNKYFI
jgi:2-polyprenyl-6-hydroxyphenyl methylase/3-demethylubiquinone-9 3-methyltransferase